MICAINRWPQSAIKAGEPIVTVGSDERRYIVCYVRQEQHVDPKEGMDVDVRKRAAIAPTVRTVVERSDRRSSRFPYICARDPKYPRVGPARPHHPAEGFSRSSGRALRGHVQDRREEQRLGTLPAFGFVCRGWHAFTRPSKTWHNRKKPDRPRVGMFAPGVPAQLSSPDMPTRGRLRFSLLFRASCGRVKACHPIGVSAADMRTRGRPPLSCWR